TSDNDDIEVESTKSNRGFNLRLTKGLIIYTRRKNRTHQQDIDDLKRQNALLKQQVVHWRRRGRVPNCPSSDGSLHTSTNGGATSAFDGAADCSSEPEPAEHPTGSEKLLKPMVPACERPM
uniref:Uncharacterized protein n=1 Tax=Oryctolagus cuniculus TaxID=9986 RepID=A0A5F9D137_RABIT